MADRITQSFQVCVHDTAREVNIGFGVGIDGKDLPGLVLFRLDKRSKEKPDYPSGVVRGYQPSRRKFHPFTFSKCILLDDDDATTSTAVGSKVGQIEVDLAEVMFRKSKKRKRDETELPTSPRRVSERLQKGVVHCVELGEEVKLEDDSEETERDVVDCTGLHRDLVTFVFKYRPIEVLRAQRIAPPLIHPGVIDVDKETDEREIKKEVELDRLAEHRLLTKQYETKIKLLEERKQRRERVRTLRPRQRIKSEPQN